MNISHINVFEWEALNTDQKLLKLHDIYSGKAEEYEQHDEED